jgi:hypothetical protein
VGPDPRPSGPRGQPVGQSLSQFGPRLDGHIATSVNKGYPMLEVGGTQEEWPASERGLLPGHPSPPN